MCRAEDKLEEARVELSEALEPVSILQYMQELQDVVAASIKLIKEPLHSRLAQGFEAEEE